MDNPQAALVPKLTSNSMLPKPERSACQADWYKRAANTNCTTDANKAWAQGKSTESQFSSMPTMGPIRGSENAQASITHQAWIETPIQRASGSVCADAAARGSYPAARTARLTCANASSEGASLKTTRADSLAKLTETEITPVC